MLHFTKSVTKDVTKIKQVVHMGQAILKLMLFVSPFLSAHATVKILLLCLVLQASGSGAGLESFVPHKLQHH